MPTPLKRHPALQPLSKEHHQILLLGFKIRQGLKNKVEPERIMNYCVWFFEAYLQPHFEKEQTHLSHILGEVSDDISKLKQNHQEVEEAFHNISASYSVLQNFEDLIVSHVRFEERVLFQDIQTKLTENDICYLEKHLQEQEFQEHLEDVFWQ